MKQPIEWYRELYQNGVGALAGTSDIAAIQLDAIDKRLDALIEERNSLKAENERLRARPELREIVGELRIMRDFIQDGAPTAACNRVLALLRRLDESPNGGTE